MIFELLPQLAHVDTCVVKVALVVRPPNVTTDLAVSEHLAEIGHQQGSKQPCGTISALGWLKYRTSSANSSVRIGLPTFRSKPPPAPAGRLAPYKLSNNVVRDDGSGQYRHRTNVTRIWSFT
jgi:hypothetical protein